MDRDKKKPRKRKEDTEFGSEFASDEATLSVMNAISMSYSQAGLNPKKEAEKE
ncbi:hypothetical protein [Thermoflavimicrobium daqui]|jgi:hypothetical protein|uniref:hypothetical protein n=1 Tax=Thermoflavimicrobium daqui TaxID=2137476 RepID=UPI00143D9129|nr:hypothetical protein [Thermoflavimicrobium daqui]